MRNTKKYTHLLFGTLTSLSLTVGLSGCGGGGASSGDSRVTSASVDSSGGATDGCATKAYAPNYSGDTDPKTGKANVLRTWSNLPLKIYFAPGTLLTPARQSAALAGFDWWVAAENGAVSYLVTTDAANADITVSFEQSGETEYGALTTYLYDAGNHLTQASITFNVTYINRDALLTPAAAHEFGHALGIDGHSANQADVMAYSASVYNLTGLSTRDINTVKTDYSCGTAARSVFNRKKNVHVHSVTVYD